MENVGSDSQDDCELVARAVSGDRQALEQLLLMHYGQVEARVKAKFSRSARASFDVDDILQETFTQAFRDIAKFRQKSPAAFLAWLKAIAEHRLLDELKAQRRKKRGGEHRQLQLRRSGASTAITDVIELLSDHAGTPSQIVALGEARIAIELGMRDLSPAQRRAFRLRYLAGKSVEETAAAMNCTPGAVRGLVDRAKENMRAALGRLSLYITGGC